MILCWKKLSAQALSEILRQGTKDGTMLNCWRSTHLPSFMQAHLNTHLQWATGSPRSSPMQPVGNGCLKKQVAGGCFPTCEANSDAPIALWNPHTLVGVIWLHMMGRHKK